MVRLEFLDDPLSFLAAAGEHLAADPVVNTVVASVTQRLLADQEAGSSWDHLPHRWWLVVRDGDGDQVVGVAMRTAPFAPYPVFVLPMPEDAAVALATALHARGEHVGGVNGALPAAQTCADELARLGGGTVTVHQHTRLHALATVSAPRPAFGRMRRARPEEAPLALEWFQAFHRDAAEQAGRAPETAQDAWETLDGLRQRIDDGQIWVWEHGGQVVHLTAMNLSAFGATRLGPVYTPPGQRGRGYAGNTVAQLSQRILDAGERPCLYTDQDNPGSNRLYAGLGFEPVVDMVDLEIH